MKDLNSIKHTIILISFMFCVSACCINESTHDKTIKISAEAKQWDPYQKGQTVVFEADTAIPDDTFSVTIHRQNRRFVREERCRKVYEETIGISLANEDNKIELVADLFVDSIAVYTSRTVIAEVSIYRFQDKNFTDKKPPPDKYHETISLNGQSYSEVIHIRNSFDKSESCAECFTDIYYGKNEGFISFKHVSGTQWFKK